MKCDVYTWKELHVNVALSGGTTISFQSVMKCDVYIREELQCRVVRWHDHFLPERHEV